MLHFTFLPSTSTNAQLWHSASCHVTDALFVYVCCRADEPASTGNWNQVVATWYVRALARSTHRISSVHLHTPARFTSLDIFLAVA